MAERITLVGKPIDNELEVHLIPGADEGVYAKPGTFQLEREVVAGGRAVRSRYWLIDGGKEILLLEFLDQS